MFLIKKTDALEVLFRILLYIHNFAFTYFDTQFL